MTTALAEQGGKQAPFFWFPTVRHSRTTAHARADSRRLRRTVGARRVLPSTPARLKNTFNWVCGTRVRTSLAARSKARIFHARPAGARRAPPASLSAQLVRAFRCATCAVVPLKKGRFHREPITDRRTFGPLRRMLRNTARCTPSATFAAVSTRTLVRAPLAASVDAAMRRRSALGQTAPSVPDPYGAFAVCVGRRCGAPFFFGCKRCGERRVNAARASFKRPSTWDALRSTTPSSALGEYCDWQGGGAF